MTRIDVTIRELAEMVKRIVGYHGNLVFDSSKPDGTLRKLQNVSRMSTIGWYTKLSLKDGIEKNYQWFLKNGPN